MFGKIEDAIKAMANGEMICLADNENEENEIDFCAAAQFITPKKIYDMARLGSGLICTPMSRDYAERLNFGYMVEHNEDKRLTNFTVSFDGKWCNTGISAKERYETILKVCDENALATDFTRPGHCFGLIAKDGGLLERYGHTEASIELCRLANLKKVSVICEILLDENKMLTVKEWQAWNKDKNYKLFSIDELKKYVIDSAGIPF